MGKERRQTRNEKRKYLLKKIGAEKQKKNVTTRRT